MKYFWTVNTNTGCPEDGVQSIWSTEDLARQEAERYWKEGYETHEAWYDAIELDTSNYDFGP